MTSVDVLNTLNGGISEPFLSYTEQTKGREIRVRVPGVDRDAMHVVINDNTLSVYYLVPIESAGKIIQMPQVVYNQKIPNFIEANGIKASYDDRDLLIELPFKERMSGHNRKIQIGEE